MSEKQKTWLRAGLGLVIFTAVFYWLLRQVDFERLWQALTNVRWVFAALALLSVSVNTLAKAIRWRGLASEKGRSIRLSRYLAILLAGQMLNTLLPSRLGDLARAYALGGENHGRNPPGRTYVFGTIVLEKLFDSLAYGLLFGLLLALMPLPAWIGGSILTFLIGILLVSGGILLLAFFPGPFAGLLNLILQRLPERLRGWLAPRLQSGLTSLQIIRRRRELLWLALWTILIWLAAIANNQLILLALDIHLPWTAALLVLIGLQAGISVPTVPGALGVFEYICVLALARFGIDETLALSYGLLLHAVVLVPSTLAGAISFWSLGMQKHRHHFRDAVV